MATYDELKAKKEYQCRLVNFADLLIESLKQIYEDLRDLNAQLLSIEEAVEWVQAKIDKDFSDSGHSIVVESDSNLLTRLDGDVKYIAGLHLDPAEEYFAGIYRVNDYLLVRVGLHSG